ncbi:hypothetical protein J6590_093778 [Homalodisca vitripennis]|nr:hypothetical protein J6590_093778 [Homalodisca vitripennis]
MEWENRICDNSDAIRRELDIESDGSYNIDNDGHVLDSDGDFFNVEDIFEESMDEDFANCEENCMETTEESFNLLEAHIAPNNDAAVPVSRPVGGAKDPLRLSGRHFPRPLPESSSRKRKLQRPCYVHQTHLEDGILVCVFLLGVWQSLGLIETDFAIWHQIDAILGRRCSIAETDFAMSFLNKPLK